MKIRLGKSAKFDGAGVYGKLHTLSNAQMSFVHRMCTYSVNNIVYSLLYVYSKQYTLTL